MSIEPGRTLTRRKIIQGALAGAALFARRAAGQSTDFPYWKTELRQLGPGIFAYVQADGPGIPSLSVSNAGLILDDRSMMAIDALGAPLHAKAFIAAAKNAAPGKPFDWLILTHHHLDHIEGINTSFRPKWSDTSIAAKRSSETRLPSAVWEKREGWADGVANRASSSRARFQSCAGRQGAGSDWARGTGWSSSLNPINWPIRRKTKFTPLRRPTGACRSRSCIDERRARYQSRHQRKLSRSAEAPIRQSGAILDCSHN